MIIGIFFESHLGSGGSYTYSLNIILKLKKLFKKKNKFIIYTHYPENIKILKRFNINVRLIKFSLLDRFLLKVNKVKFFKNLFDYSFLLSSLETKLKKDNINIIFYPALSDTTLIIKNFKFISTVLDLCHIYYNRNFPEISKKEFIYREYLNNYCLNKSILTITNSNELKKQISTNYKININKVINFPFEPKKIVHKKNYNKKKYDLKYKKMKNIFFYPAHIWSHKNHLSLLKSAKSLNLNDFSFVFSGRDKGNKKNLLEYAKKKNVNNIYFTGFLPPEEIDYLYRNCKCVIMPSYFGPTNLPPLEAFIYNKPLIYNKSFESEIGKNTCYFVNVDKPAQISKAINLVIRKKYPKKFVKNSKKKLSNLNNEIDQSLKQIKALL